MCRRELLKCGCEQLFCLCVGLISRELRIVGLHALLTWHLRGVKRIGELRELRGGLLLGSDGGDFVFELCGRVVSLDHGCDDFIELRTLRRR